MFTRAQLPPDRRPARVASGRAGLAVVGDLAGQLVSHGMMGLRVKMCVRNRGFSRIDL